MKNEEELKNYYRDLIRKVETPPCPPGLIQPARNFNSRPLTRFLLAASLAAAFIPLGLSAGRPTELAVRAAEFSRRQNLESKIINGVVVLKKISAVQSSGGIKNKFHP